jgi:hypothetical protein
MRAYKWTRETAAITDIIVNPEILPRIATDQNDATVREYVEILRIGAMPPPRAVRVDGKLYLVDGSYRLLAHKVLKKTEFEVEITDGTLSDALWIATQSNAEHGLKLNAGQKRRAVESLLRDNRFAMLDAIALAQHVGCSLSTARNAITTVNRETAARRQEAAGKSLEDVNRELAAADDGESGEPSTLPMTAPTRNLRTETATGGKSPNGEARAPTDAAGKTIPEWLIPDYNKAANLDRRCDEFTAIVKTIETKDKVATYGTFIDLAEIVACVTTIRNALQDAKFYKICPECEAAGQARKTCACSGRGWFSKDAWWERKQAIVDPENWTTDGRTM